MKSESRQKGAVRRRMDIEKGINEVIRQFGRQMARLRRSTK